MHFAGTLFIQPRLATVKNHVRAVFANGFMEHVVFVFSVGDSLRGPSVKIGTTKRRLAWPLRKDDMHTSRSVNDFLIEIEGRNSRGGGVSPTSGYLSPPLNEDSRWRMVNERADLWMNVVLPLA